MTDRLQVMGLVLSVMPVGEYDRRLTILTKERGKISVWAKGARRPNSPFISCAQPFVFAKFTVFEGRNTYNLASAEVTNYFSELRGNIDWTYYGFYFCELAEYMTQENNDEHMVLALLYQSLRALSNDHIGLSLTKIIYEFKMFYLNGEGPQVYECTRCKSKQEEKVFSIRSGGFVCKTCAGEDYEPSARRKRLLSAGLPDNDFYNLLPSTWFTLQFIATTPPEKIYTFTVSEPVLHELREISDAFRNAYTRHEFKSLTLIESIHLTNK